MKKLMTLFCVSIANLCFANAQYHEFEGVSEAYNIRNLRVLARALPENPVIIEAGSYHGRDTEKLAKRFPLAQIFAFEPLSTAFPKLSEAMQPYSNVYPYKKALDKTSGIKVLYVCHGTYGQNPIFEFHSSLLKPTGPSAINLIGPTERVSCISLHDFCKENQIDKIDMLWLSTEGNELQILEGAQDLLSQISLIYVRSQLYYTRDSISMFADLKRFMEKKGFILLSHFYLKNIHGDALFIKREKFNKLEETK